MTWLHPTKQRRAPPGRRVVTLSPSQIRWLGALLLATQLPMLGYVPVWVACLGTLLVALRFVLVARSVKNRDPAPQIIRSWILGLLALVTAVAIRHSLGYFIGRDPCVAFLFALIGVKFLETRNARDGTLIVCLACLLIVTPFFYSQSLLAAALAIPAVVLMGGALQALARPDGLPPLPGGWRTPLAVTLTNVRARRSDRRDALRAVPAYRGSAVERARRPLCQLGSVRSHVAGRHQRAVAVRRGRFPRRLRGRGPAAVASLLARAGAFVL